MLIYIQRGIFYKKKQSADILNKQMDVSTTHRFSKFKYSPKLVFMKCKMNL